MFSDPTAGLFRENWTFRINELHGDDPFADQDANQTHGKK
jgi:hypothetical protein